MPPYKPVSKNEHYLVFVSDFASYHLEIIQSGIQNYFEQGALSLSYIHMDISEIRRLFWKSMKGHVSVIGALRSNEAIDYFRKNEIPCLSLSGDFPNTSLGFDVLFEGEGTLAAQYFIKEMKLENLGFVGYQNSFDHNRRKREFVRKADADRISVGICEYEKPRHQLPFYSLDDPSHLCTRHEQTCEFLARLKKPSGIFCGDDRIALNLFYIAEMMGISVPAELAILGVGSRAKGKGSWREMVSIIQIDHHKQGYTAARLMDEFVNYGKAPHAVRLQPAGIAHGQTTVRHEIGDSMVREIMVLIQQSPEITSEEISTRFNISRRVLDIRFQRAANITVAKVIEIERFARAKELIQGSRYSMESIASLAGYPNRRAMRRSFYRFVNMSPRQFQEFRQQPTRKE